MRRELEQKLVERWPSWFKVSGDPRKTRMTDGFAQGDGWCAIVWRLCEDLESLVTEAEKATGQQFEVTQVKEKFGGRRFYINHGTDAIRKRIEKAMVEASVTCFECGNPGKQREDDLGRRAL